MANVNTGYGLVFVRSLDGSAMQMIRCQGLASYGTALYKGDPVILDGSGSTDGLPSVNIGVGGGTTTNFFGVVAGFEPNNPDALSVTYRPASTAQVVIVIPALPEYVFRINASGTTGSNPNDIGLGFDLVSGSGSALTGQSGWQLDMGEDANAGATTGRNMRVLGFDQRQDNVSAAAGTDTTGVDLLVQFRETFWIDGAGY